MEKAREATDAANLRSAYAECSAAVLTGDDSKTGDKVQVTKTDGDATSAYEDVTLTQQKDGWQDSSIKDIGGVKIDKITVTKGETVRVTVNADGTATFNAAQ